MPMCVCMHPLHSHAYIYHSLIYINRTAGLLPRWLLCKPYSSLNILTSFKSTKPASYEIALSITLYKRAQHVNGRSKQVSFFVLSFSLILSVLRNNRSCHFFSQDPRKGHRILDRLVRTRRRKIRHGTNLKKN